jgi:hypothetical protein
MATIIDGNGIVTAEGTSTTQGRLRLGEDTDNGTNYVELQAPASVASNVTFTLPSADGTNGQAITTNGSGTLSFSTISSDPGTHTVVVTTGNGYGSTSTTVRRFQTTVTNTGTSITYADSSTLGATFTINATGFYAVSYTDRMASGNKYWAVTLNSTGLTIAPEDFPSNGISSQRLIQVGGDAAANMPCASVVFRATAGDVVRAQADTALQDNNTDTIFCIRRIS